MEYTTGERSISRDYVFKAISWILLLAVSASILKRWIKRRKIVTELNKLPGFPPSTLIGNLGWSIQIYSKKLKFPTTVYILERIIAHCFIHIKEGVYIFWFSQTPIINVYKADFMELILTHSVASSKSHEYRFLHSWLGQGLITSKGDKWKSRRKILTPAFHFKILENFIPVFNEQSVILVHKLYDFKSEECPDVATIITCCTLDIVGESVMGVHINAQENSESEYVKAIRDVGDAFNRRTVRVWQWLDFIFYATSDGKKFKNDVKILHRFTKKVIKQRKEAMLEKCTDISDTSERCVNDIGQKTHKKKPFLDLLLDMHINQQLLSEEDIKEEVDTFMFAGHDTTAMGITWALYCIGLYPHIQKKLIEELDSIFAGDKERPISLEDIRDMKYLECTLKEAQRIYPSVPIIGRELSDDIVINGINVPKGTTIHCFIYMLHRNPEEFPNPEIFDPDRFLPEVSMNRHPYAFIPFSAGPRNCIGQRFAMMEEKVIISNILRHFKVISLDPRDKIPINVEFVLRPASSVRMKFIPREISP